MGIEQSLEKKEAIVKEFGWDLTGDSPDNPRSKFFFEADAEKIMIFLEKDKLVIQQLEASLKESQDKVAQWITDYDELESENHRIQSRLQEAEKEVQILKSQKEILLEDLETWKRLCDQVRLPMEQPLQYQKQFERIAELEKEVARLNGIIKKQVEEIAIHFGNEENCYQNLCKDQKEYENKIKELSARLAERDEQIRRIYETLAWHPFDNFPGQFYKRYEVLKEQITKHKAVVELLRETESFFGNPEEWDGPDQADLHCRITDALTSLEGDKLQGGRE